VASVDSCSAAIASKGVSRWPQELWRQSRNGPGDLPCDRPAARDFIHRVHNTQLLEG
jgi:hypothetical protein